MFLSLCRADAQAAVAAITISPNVGGPTAPRLTLLGARAGSSLVRVRAGGTLGRVVLRLELIAARVIAAASRLAGTGGGTTLPGKLLWKAHPGAVDRLAARLSAGTVLISATNGKTTTTAMVAQILRPRHRLAHNASGANLVSGVASTLLAAGGAELGLFEVDEGALARPARRRA